MYEYGQFNNYVEFGTWLVTLLRENGYDDEVVQNKPEKQLSLLLHGDIEVCYKGKYTHRHINSGKLNNYSYDCVIKYNGEQVQLQKICEDILEKTSANVDVKNAVYKLIRKTAIFPLHDVTRSNYSYELIDNSNLGYTSQELVNLMSYIGIIEEFNYPQINQPSYFGGRRDCFGRYIEVLIGGHVEYNNLVDKRVFNSSIRFIENDNYLNFYPTQDIYNDRWKVTDYNIPPLGFTNKIN